MVLELARQSLRSIFGLGVEESPGSAG